MKQVRLHIEGRNPDGLSDFRRVRLLDDQVGGFTNEDKLEWKTKSRRLFSRRWKVTGVSLYDDNGSEMGDGPLDRMMRVRSGDTFAIDPGALRLTVRHSR